MTIFCTLFKDSHSLELVDEENNYPVLFLKYDVFYAKKPTKTNFSEISTVVIFHFYQIIRTTRTETGIWLERIFSALITVGGVYNGVLYNDEPL